MNAQVFDDSVGPRVARGVPCVEGDIASVFLVKSSFSHPYATGTFDSYVEITIQTILGAIGLPLQPHMSRRQSMTRGSFNLRLRVGRSWTESVGYDNEQSMMVA